MLAAASSQAENSAAESRGVRLHPQPSLVAIFFHSLHWQFPKGHRCKKSVAVLFDKDTSMFYVLDLQLCIFQCGDKSFPYDLFLSIRLGVFVCICCCRSTWATAII